MPTIPEIFDGMPSHYQPGVIKAAKTFYFSIGEHKYTVSLSPQACKVEKGKTIENCDIVLKATPEVFEKLLRGKMPGALDVTLGRIKTNDPGGLAILKDVFKY